MSLERSNPPPDPEFGTHRPGPLGGDLGDEPQAYLRLVANPFLGLAYLAGWLAFLYQSVYGGFAGPLTPMLVVILLAAVGLVPGLMQYHCLDCGSTGRLSKWRKHLCHKPLARREAGTRRVVRGPNPSVQVVLWIWLLVLAAVALKDAGLSLSLP